MFVYFNILNCNESLFYTLIKSYNTSFDQNDTEKIINIIIKF